DWPFLASQPVWSTSKTLERKRYEKAKQEKINREQDERNKRQHEEMMASRALMERHKLWGLKAVLIRPIREGEDLEAYKQVVQKAITAIEEGGQRRLFTVLDIGTNSTKAMIVEVVGEQVEVLGVGRHPQSYFHIPDDFDIPDVITNCNE